MVPQLPLFIKLRVKCDYEVSQEGFVKLGVVCALIDIPATERWKANLCGHLGRAS